ncbi:ABC transporter ATP-binding protein [Desulfobacter vibrioformis]|uniref:ABC transporter ATP-binding protein n=1 Tax=Desulfobacter vibrioformis TaxID=34031 RepID=UPI00054EFC10|nr:ABC transporter ATP-binding protein [Desulfobacter vibrioformis]
MKSPCEKTPVQRTLLSWSLEGGLWLQAGLFLASILSACIRIFPIEFQKRIVNEAIRNKDLDLLYIYCAGFLGSVLMGLGLKYGVLFLQSLVGESILSRMRNAFFRHALTLPWSFYIKHSPGAIPSPLINQLGPVGDYLGNAWAVPLTNILTLVLLGGYLAFISPVLALFSLCVYPLALVLLPRIQSLTNQANRERLTLGQELNGKITETFSGIDDIQAHSGYNIEQDAFSSRTYRLRRIRIKWRLSKLGYKAVSNFFINLSPFFIFLAGGSLAVKGSLDMGELVAFLSAQALMFTPWTELMGYIQIQQDAKVQYRKVQSFFDKPPAQRDIPSRKPFEPVKGNIEIKNLGLAYSDNIRVLENISLSINAGEMVALVGRSGSGKSSLMNCLAGKIRQYEGTILVGGNDIKNLNSPDLAPFWGVVSQFPYIFDGSLKQNLLYPVKASGAGQEPNQDDMILAIQQAGLFPDLLLFGLNRVPQPEFYDKAGQELDQMRDMVREGLPRDIRDQIRFFPKNTNPKEFTLLEQILGGKPEAMDATAVMNWLPKLVPLLITYDLLEIIIQAGLDFQVGFRGERLSGGQRQRLALAAALLKQPGILLLDEMGSGLDPGLRQRIFFQLTRLRGSCTVVAVEHNLSHIRQYDYIGVLHQGRLVEWGDYDGLMAKKERFYTMMSDFQNAEPGSTP